MRPGRTFRQREPPLRSSQVLTSRVGPGLMLEHPEKPNGILYPSRHNPDELCIALFERVGIKLTVQETTPLSDLRDKISDLLNEHWKSLTGYS